MNDKEKQKKGFFSGFLASSKTGKKEKNQTEQGKNTEKERPEEKKQEFVILLVRSLKGIENYKEILEKKDFDFKKINENLGYVLVHNKEGKALRNKIYEFAENLIEESKTRKDTLTIVLNNGLFEKNINTIKQFVKINRKILDYYPGKLIIGERVYSGIKTKKEFQKKEIKINEKSIFVRINN